MDVTRKARITLSIMALVAMTCVHVLRPVRGFECDCGDAPVFTVSDHCHGPHSGICHEEEGESETCHREDGHPAGDDTHTHTALIESLLAVKADASLFASVAATTPVLLAVIQLPDVVESGASSPRSVVVHPDRRSWPQILSRTIALLV